jgi:endonuclease G
MYTAKNVQRKDEWATDPLLGNDSTNPGSYYGRLNPTDKGEDPYARGHQLPSADRLCIREANRQTFYGTNITPQLFDHNGGIWSDLEGRVRVIAEKSDTTYVVTGCLVEGGRTVYDTDGQPMTVPTAYFKALLRYSKSSTLGQWNAAAFYLEHRVYSENIGKQHSMSIDELEEITGIDFFANLPAKIGESQADKVEAADPADSSIWW